MKKVLTLIAIAIAFCVPVLAQDVLTNKNILDLKMAGLGKDAIKVLIAKSSCRFETDVNSVIKLKKDGIDDESIAAMVEKGSTVPVVENSTKSNNPIVAKLKEQGSGIYYQAADGTMQPLEPNVYSRTKQSISAATLFVGKLAPVNYRLAISGSKSNLRLEDTRPKFYFFFSDEKKNLNDQMTSAWGSTATSANQFLLIKFDQKKKTREVLSGSGSSVSDASGISDKQQQPFRFKRIEEGVYEIYFDENLKPGEYGFMYAGTISGSNLNPNVYDFGVEKK